MLGHIEVVLFLPEPLLSDFLKALSFVGKNEYGEKCKGRKSTSYI